MTNERLDQILKQALAPDIDVLEIQILRKAGKNKMKMKKIVSFGLAACATAALIVTVGCFGGISKTEGDCNADISDTQSAPRNNFFAITAYAAELPEGTISGNLMGLSNVNAGVGSSEYLNQRFAISGQNIETVKISTNKCNIYSVTPICEGKQDEHLVVEGDTYKDFYNANTLYGMSIPRELWSTNEDMQTAAHEDVDQVDGAILTIEVTFFDSSIETHQYRLETGKIFVPSDENGYLQWDNLTRFLTPEEENAEVPYTYGYLMEKID